MSCNRQNFRPAGNNFGTGRGGACATNCVAPVTACETTCQVPIGVICGGTQAGCGAPCPTAQLEEMPLAMAYVPWQNFGTMYPVQQAIRQGTLFPELNLDFMGRRCN